MTRTVATNVDSLYGKLQNSSDAAVKFNAYIVMPIYFHRDVYKSEYIFESPRLSKSSLP